MEVLLCCVKIHHKGESIIYYRFIAFNKKITEYMEWLLQRDNATWWGHDEDTTLHSAFSEALSYIHHHKHIISQVSSKQRLQICCLSVEQAKKRKHINFSIVSMRGGGEENLNIQIKKIVQPIPPNIVAIWHYISSDRHYTLNTAFPSTWWQNIKSTSYVQLYNIIITYQNHSAWCLPKLFV